MKVTNKKAFFDFQITDRIEAGINLTGSEVRAVKEGHVDLSGSFVRITGAEAYLVNAKVFPLQYARPEGYDETRTRKLLLHKNEIIALKGKMDGAGLALIPTSIYETHHLVKVELALGKGKKQFEKKEAKKRADIARDVEEELASDY
jgi:SsrA-binding protein